MKKTHTRNFWVGFTDGEPHVAVYTDDYGLHRGMQVFTQRSEARRRFEDVRRCEVQVKEYPKVSANERGKIK